MKPIGVSYGDDGEAAVFFQLVGASIANCIAGGTFCNASER